MMNSQHDLSTGAGEEISVEDLEQLDERALGLRIIIENSQGRFLGVVNTMHKRLRMVYLEKMTILKTNRSVNFHGFFYKTIDRITIVGHDPEAKARLLNDLKKIQGQNKVASQVFVPTTQSNEDDTVSEASFYSEAYEPVGACGANKANFDVPHVPIIEEAGDQLFELFDAISKAEQIEIYPIGRNLGRFGSLALLAVKASDLHIIDVAKIGMKTILDDGFSSILSENDIKKVLFDSRPFQDYLHHNYELEMNNVFDIQATSLYIHSEESGNIPIVVNSIPTLIENYLPEIPEESTWAISEQISDALWFTRPVVPIALVHVVQAVDCIRPLQNAMLGHILSDLQNFTKLFVGSTAALSAPIAKTLDPTVVAVNVRESYVSSRTKDKGLRRSITYTKGY